MNEHEPVTCEVARAQLPLLLYGELEFDAEERVESHLEGCAQCGAALERQRALHAALDAVAVVPSPVLLNRCREDLRALLSDPLEDIGRGWWDRFLSGFRLTWLRPVTALMLVAAGYLGAQLVRVTTFDGSGRFHLAGIAGSRVRTVATQPDGSVEIVLEDMRQRKVQGSINDQAIRTLLLSTAKEAEDPGLRAGTVAMLVGAGDAADVRDALMFAMEHDEDTTVRRKAMEGLKSYTQDPNVQAALAKTLLREGNSGMRTQAIDLLANRTERQLNRQIVGTLQELMSREEDAYVRERCQRLLRALKASSEMY